MQEYLKLGPMNKSQAIVVIKFRLRMSPFSENFKAGQESKQENMSPELVQTLFNI